MHSSDITILFLGLAVLLGAAHTFGELARRMGQPVVVGEMIAGLLLGPTCFGVIAPGAQQWLFPHEGPAAVALDAVVALAVALVLLIAGLEVDLSTVWRQGTAALAIGMTGLAVPLALGGAWAWYAPDWWGMPVGGRPAHFAAFFGAAMAVSALPVLAKIFLDMGLFQSDFGMLVLVAATINNLLAWLAFSVVLGSQTGDHPLTYTVGLTVTFVVLTLTIGRWIANKALVWVQAHLTWPAGVLGFLLLSCLVGAAVTEAIGIHAIFGAFLVGIAIGDSPRLREQTRFIMHRFVEGVLAPIFVAAIGLEVHFATNFHPGLVLRVVIVGIALKVLGCSLAARLSGLPGREAWAVGWAMSARGELGIVLGLLAWHAGVIRERLFVAFVVLAVVTSGLAAPMLQWLLRRGRAWSFSSALDRIICIPDFAATDSREAIENLSTVAANHVGLEPDVVIAAVLNREAIMGTGLGQGLAVPHAQLPSIKGAVVVAAIARQGVQFDGLDSEPVRLIFLILTPEAAPETQIEILAAIARIAHKPHLIRDICLAQTATDLLAALRVADVEAA